MRCRQSTAIRRDSWVLVASRAVPVYTIAGVTLTDAYAGSMTVRSDGHRPEAAVRPFGG
jgi:hypothetical protein